MLQGKSGLTFRKSGFKEQRSLAIGFKKLQFAHKATAGDTGINLSALVFPSEMTGFTNPSNSELLAAQLFTYRKNLTITSTLRGVLMDYLSYKVNSSSQIEFVGFTAEDGEIFIGTIDHATTPMLPAMDIVPPYPSTGDLAIGQTDFNVGMMFEVNKFPSAQVGAGMVFRNGAQQFRNTGNSSTVLDGNYYEVNAGNGTGQIIRFNTAPVGQADSILYIPNGLLTYAPTGSMTQLIESLSGKVDSMVPTLAGVAGVPESTFGGVSQVDLKAFGDSVLDHGSRISELESGKTLNMYGGSVQVISNGVDTILNTWVQRFNSSTTMTVSSDRITFNATGKVSVNAACIIEYVINSSAYANIYHYNAAGVSLSLYNAAGGFGNFGATASLSVSPGDYVVYRVYQAQGGNRNTAVSGNWNHMSAIWLGV